MDLIPEGKCINYMIRNVSFRKIYLRYYIRSSLRRGSSKDLVVFFTKNCKQFEEPSRYISTTSISLNLCRNDERSNSCT